jgi:beta-galactosidase
MIRLFIFTLLILPTLTFAQPRKKINFDDDWRFHFGHAADPVKDFNYGLSAIFSKSGKTDNTALGLQFNDSGWRKLNLPHDWAVELPFVNHKDFDVMAHGYKPVGGRFPETSIGWYRKKFSLPVADSAKRYAIEFDGVFRNAEVWLNGIYLGRNQSGYVGVRYDITDYINFGRNNILVVRVDASQYEGWFYEGAGIYRHVWLHTYNNVHIDDTKFFTWPKVESKGRAIVKAEVPVSFNFEKAAGYVFAYVIDRDGKKVTRVSSVPFHSTNNFPKTFSLYVNNPRLWTLEDPYLYRIVVLLKQGNKTIDSLNTRIGIRTFHFDPEKGFFLNGVHTKILGTNNHQDHAGIGSALPDYMHYYRIRLLKEMGSNAYRASHHAPAPELLDACDSLGMLVMDEQRLLNSGAEYMNQFERIIYRDRNHPSVFMWSIGNEDGWIHTTTMGKRIAETLVAKQKELDPSRTSTYAADVANVYQGVNEVIPVRGFNYRQFAVADYHRDHPLQPVIGTEMGSTVTTRGIYVKDSVRAYVPDQDITAPWWASTAETWWKLAAENPWWAGGFIWTGFDYRGEPTPYQWPNISSHFGVMDVCGFPKNIYYYYKSWWTNEDVLHISPQNWNAAKNGSGWKQGDSVDVWVNTNADDVELFLNGRSLGKKIMPRNSHLKWKVIYEPGVLKAVANKKRRKLEAKVETTGDAAEIVVTPYKTTVLADGRDVTVINISAIDRQGRLVPDANMRVDFSVKGDAKIVGVGNGDPSSHEQDKYNDTAAHRNLFNGKCQVIVQSGKNPSTIHYEARSQGLWSGNTDIISVAPAQTQTAGVKNPGKFKRVEKILGADISFLPELEARGIKFSDNGVQKDAIEILKDHGMNYIRLRLFHTPSNDSGYSPKKGFCDLPHTLAMAKRIKAAGLKWLLDFHYSDYWADPGKQYKPLAWKDLPFNLLRDSLYAYTKAVMLALKAQGTLPDMVQIGNEVNHGILWPDGNIKHLDSLATLLRAGTDAVLSVAPNTVMMLHPALGGQNDESVWFINAMEQRGVHFDIIGLSYYPKWHGTLDDLRNNMTDLERRFNRDIVVVEYSQLKKEVADIAFNLPDGHGKGTMIWEPLNTWEAVFDREGKANAFLKMYDEIAQKYMRK